MSEPSNIVHIRSYERIASSPEVRHFLKENAHLDELRLILAREILGVPANLIANQITGRKKSKTKIPRFFETEEVLFPPGLNLEQSSSQKTAQLKSSILAEACKGGALRMADLSGGFGVDSYFFSTRFDQVDYVEPDSVLAWLAEHNHRKLGAQGISYHVGTAQEFLSHGVTGLSAAYIDPSRRSNSRKVIRLEDCEPNIIALQDRVFEITDLLLVKTSPVLDITAALRELASVHSVYVVSVDQECRELLFLCKRGFKDEPRICTVHLNKDATETFDFHLSEEKELEMTTGPVLKYLYEPNPSIMKSGGFKSVAKVFGIPKIHPNSNLLSSDKLLGDFPGRVFEVTTRVSTNVKELRTILPGMKANVVVRNFPLSADQLKKKLHLSDGGSDYIIGTTSLREGKVILLTRRLR